MKKVAIIMGSDSDLPVVSKAADTLKQFGVPFEMHIYPEGPHGYSTAEADVLGGNATKASEHASAWVACAVKWLEFIFS